MHCNTFKQDNYSTVGGDGGCRVSEVWANTTSPMPDHKGFMLQELSEIHPLTPAVQGLANIQKMTHLFLLLSKMCVFVLNVLNVQMIGLFQTITYM